MAGLVSDYIVQHFKEVTYRPPPVLLMGSERRGLSPEQQALCDHVVRIPMIGRCDSLNLGVAASLLLYEIFNQQRDVPLQPLGSPVQDSPRGVSKQDT